MKSKLNFLFPIPSIILLLLLGVLMSTAETEGVRVGFFDWIGLMVTSFIFLILPIDIVIYLFKKARKSIKIKSNQKSEKNKLNFEKQQIGKEKEAVAKEREELTKIKQDLFDTLNNVKEISHKLEEEKKSSENTVVEVRITESQKQAIEITKSESCNTYDDEWAAYEQYAKEIIANETEQKKKEVPFDYMDGYQFEHYCAGILEKNGYEHIEVTQSSGDHGIDILAEKNDITYAIQCKCYSSNIGNKAI